MEKNKPTVPLSKRKRMVFSLIAALLPIAIIFTIGEITLRKRAKKERRKNEQAWAQMYATHPPLQQGLARLMDLLKASKHDDIIYELRPNISVEFRGAQVTVNRWGFRGAMFSDDAAGTFRIVALGDSSLFGWGVNDNETYLTVLTTLFNKRFPGVRTEALNTGVPGYNTVMELATFTNRCVQYRPDMVILHQVSNDLQVPHFLTVQGGRKRPLNSYALDWLFNRGRVIAGQSDGLYMRDPGDVPEKYRHMEGKDAFRNAIRELRRLSRKHDFHLVLVSDKGAPEYLKEIARDIKAPLHALGTAARQYLKTVGIKDPVKAGVTLHRRDDHYTALGHKLIAEYLIDRLAGDKEVQRRMALKKQTLLRPSGFAILP
jgi:lysophospholipase L1-like esterase